MEIVHLVAKLRSDKYDLRTPALGRPLWRSLKNNFPHTLASILMPEHLHLIAKVLASEPARDLLSALCGQFQRRVGLPKKSWQAVPPPRIITKLQELRGNVRYLGLNECRRGLSRDPLKAVWSTYRELLGAVANPLIDTDWVRRELRYPLPGFPGRFHAYVSGDPHASVIGTEPPSAAPPSEFPSHNLADIAKAAAVATRSAVDDIQTQSLARKVFIWLARYTGWTQTKVLADFCGITPGAVRRLAARPDQAALDAGALCLGDARLTERAWTGWDVEPQSGLWLRSAA